MTTIRKTGVTEYLPAVAARPYQPYIPPTPAWTEYRRVESCITELPTTTWTTKVELVVTPFFDEATGTWSYTGIYKSVPSKSTVPGKRTCSFSTVQIDHPASPGQPYLPGQAAQPARVVENRRPGWNSGAVSVQSITGEGGYTFSAPAGVVGVVVGLTTSRSPTHPNEISHGLYLTRGTVQRMEGGTSVGSAQAYTASDVLAIQRRADGVVVYLNGSTEIGRSSGAPVTGPVSLGEVMYLAGDAVVNAKCEHVLGISVSGDMPPLAGSSSDYAAATSSGTMRPLLQGAGSASFGRMRPAQGLASNRPYASVSGQFAGMSGASYGPSVTPSIGIVNHSLFPMQGFATGVAIIPTAVSGLMAPLGGLSSNRPYGDVRGSVAPATGFSTGVQSGGNYSDLTLPKLRAGAYGSATDLQGSAIALPAISAASYGGTTASVALPAVRASASATVIDVARSASVLPAIRAVAYGAGRARSTLPSITVSATTTTVEVANAHVSLPQFSVAAHALPGGVARAAARLPRMSVAAAATNPWRGSASARLPAITAASTGTQRSAAVAVALPAIKSTATATRPWSGSSKPRLPALSAKASGGGSSAAQIPALGASSSGTTGNVARAVIRLPKIAVAATAQPARCGWANARLTALRMQHGARAAAQLPTMRSSSHAALVSFAAAYEAYVMNMGRLDETQPTNQVTRYTGLPFARIVRFMGDYYGVSATGLYRLGGGTDNGADIEWSFATGTTDFGDSTKKTLASVYLGGQLGSEATFTVSCGELPDQMHAYATTSPTAVRNHRQRFGLGRRARYYSLGVSGSGDMNLDSLEFEVLKTNRRI